MGQVAPSRAATASIAGVAAILLGLLGAGNLPVVRVDRRQSATPPGVFADFRYAGHP